MSKKTVINYNCTTQKSYGFWRFILDLFLGVITGGIWWVWLLFKFIRS